MSVAMVTGAASGIGAATTTLLRARGWDVFGTDIAAGDDVFAHDVRDEDAWDAAVAACVQRFGRLDALVSNAGTADAGPIVDLDMAKFRDLCSVHVDGAWLGARAAVARMRAQGSPARGSIVIVASIAGVKPLRGTAAYGSAKAAQVNLARALGVELGRKGDLIRVNAVCPGGTRTPMTEALYPPEYWEDAANFADVPLRDYCRAEDIAEAVAYCLEDDSEFLTAQPLVVDGGWCLSARI